MKQILTLKNLMLASCLMGASVANAQIHPLAFGPFPYGADNSDPNWYKDYVGLRFVVNSPSAVAGDKVYTFAGSSTPIWGGAVTTPIVNEQICMPPLGGDTVCAAALTPGSMAGKIGYVYRGGGVEFVCKARRCQDAGAIAVVIVNNINGGPVGMGEGIVCASAGITIPVFMIAKEDGDPITGLYRANDTARITITPWGLNLANDVGFVPGGTAAWHNYAIPSNQLGASGNPFEYKNVDGAFIANYGTNDLTNILLSTSTSFTPTGGAPAVQHTSSVTLTSFPAADSIYAMFKTTDEEYDLAASGTGRFDVTYTISSPDMTDDNPTDNTKTTSFYVTDSLYSKARYDFAGNRPVRTIGNSFSTDGFIWGPMYYVKTGGTAISRVQYSLSTNAGGILSTNPNIYLFKWVDGGNSMPQDSIIQNGEMELVSLGTHYLDGVLDTSGSDLNFSGMGDLSGTPGTVLLEANSWYYLAVGVPGGHFLGADGIYNPYPRIYGRFQANNAVLDYSSLVATSADDIAANPSIAYAPTPGTFSSFVNVVDSFNFANTRGLIPSVAMIVNNDPVISVKGSPEVVNNNKVTVFPNPAKDQLNVNVSFENMSKTATYTIIDGLGRFVSKVVHNNVKTESFALNTSTLPAGNYYLVVNSDSRVMASKFAVVK